MIINGIQNTNFGKIIQVDRQDEIGGIKNKKVGCDTFTNTMTKGYEKSIKEKEKRDDIQIYVAKNQRHTSYILTDNDARAYLDSFKLAWAETNYYKKHGYANESDSMAHLVSKMEAAWDKHNDRMEEYIENARENGRVER